MLQWPTRFPKSCQTADYLPKALASGEHKIAPKPSVIGSGFDSFQNAVDTVIKGVSAQKLVVTL